MTTTLASQLRPLLEVSDLKSNPLDQFSEWFEFAKTHQIPQHEAMALATVDPSGMPSARMVLLKHYDEQGFVFFTNYQSKKAEDIQHNPKASLLFYWHELDRQIRIQGNLVKTSRSESERYFQSRARKSQISAWASEQSQPLDHRRTLEQQYQNYEQQFYNQNPIPCPEHWGGYRLSAERFEFWVARDDRLHDRFIYTKTALGWNIGRLNP